MAVGLYLLLGYLIVPSAAGGCIGLNMFDKAEYPSVQNCGSEVFTLRSSNSRLPLFLDPPLLHPFFVLGGQSCAQHAAPRSRAQNCFLDLG